MHGLGYSLVEVREHSIGMDTRLWVLATPVDGERVALTLVSRIRRMERPRRPVVGMRFLPPGLRTRLMNRIVIAAQGRDVMQDVAIWGRKRYRPRPFLCRSDGEIGTYRRYCEQSYPDGRGANSSRAEWRDGQRNAGWAPIRHGVEKPARLYPGERAPISYMI